MFGECITVRDGHKKKPLPDRSGKGHLLVGTIDTATAGEKIKAQHARIEAAEARKKDIGQKVRHIFLTEDQINSVLDRLELNEKQPETLRLLVRKLATKVTVSRETIKVRLVLALDGAGERT